MLFKALAVAAALGTAVAQRPANMSICDYYTTALLKNNTAANQKTVLTLVVNTAVIGNYTKGNLLPFAVPGILAAGIYTDPVTGTNTSVNLLPYFSGGLASTNRGGMSGVSVNFLDDGGAAPLMLNMPANGTTSNQYKLLTHLYEYFGALLGCSMLGSTDFPAYAGVASQYEVHKFMDLSNAQVGYFITQVAYAAASFGVAASDLQIVGAALASTFGVRCAPAVAVIAAQGPQLQAVCGDPASCPIATVNASCPTTYAMPASATPTAAASGSGTAAASGTSSGAASATSSGAAAATSSKAASASTYGVSAVAAFAGLFALFL